MRRLVLAFALTGIALVAARPALAGSWVRPVAGAVTRPFAMHGSPYARGQHRGADFTAPPGTPVRAPCTGRVAVAGQIGTSGGVVTVACGPWRVSVLPVARIDVRRRARVRAGDPVGTAGASALHAGLHLGVRRAGRRFGYVDPLHFLTAGRRPSPPVGPPARGIDRRRPSRVPAAPAPAPASLKAPVAASDRGHAVLPWPAWVGVGLLLTGTSGEIVRRRQRRRRGRLVVGSRRARTRASPARGG
jgi:Peptidase family M23